MDSSGGRRPAKVLLVDDDPLIARVAGAIHTHPPCELVVCRSLAQARECLQQRCDALLLDQGLPDGEGLELLAELRHRDPHLPVIFITAQVGSRTAIEAMKRGAFDYLAKPLDLQQLERCLDLALEARRLTRTPVMIARPGETTDERSDFLVGRSPAISAVFKAIGRAAAVESPVLIIGEEGVGKLLTARAIRQHSARADGPFRVVSCNGAAAEALERELFGDQVSAGRFEQCRGGVVVLEAFDQAPMTIQHRIYHWLVEPDPVGGENPRARLIATASQDLAALVSAQRFRSELYYLLRPQAIAIPPLRERLEDLPELVDHYVQRFAKLSSSYHQAGARVSPTAFELLQSYPWPGNLDELQSVVQLACAESSGAVVASETLERLLRHPQTLSNAAPPPPEVTNWRLFMAEQAESGDGQLYASAVAEMERRLLALVFRATQGNLAQAARQLGITRGSLRKKARALGLIEGSPGGGVEQDDAAPAEAPPSNGGGPRP